MLRPASFRLVLSVTLAVLAAAAVLQIAGCSQSNTPASGMPAAANEAAANRQLQLYQQMLANSNAVGAAPIGQKIVKQYPGTSAAAEVQKSLPKIEARAKALDQQRLQNLWDYTAAKAGGLEHTAGIYTSQPAGASVQLILRRHQNWGQSVYLFATGDGFVCKELCDVVMHIDGQREVWKAYPPKTGEPAIFIKDDKAFIAALEKAKVITMDVTTKDGGRETLKFEVGGFDPAKFPPLPKK